MRQTGEAVGAGKREAERRAGGRRGKSWGTEGGQGRGGEGAGDDLPQVPGPGQPELCREPGAPRRTLPWEDCVAILSSRLV